MYDLRTKIHLTQKENPLRREDLDEFVACYRPGAIRDRTSASANPDEKITLTVATFNEFGYDELLEEYMDDNPNITIEHNKAATSNEARANYFQKLAAGSGLADIEAVEVDWLPR